jgi:hypothetical protein
VPALAVGAAFSLAGAVVALALPGRAATVRAAVAADEPRQVDPRADGAAVTAVTALTAATAGAVR